ncbi:MAG: hypothetical protein PHU34_02355, partial [Candidatus Methanoperedens sp.]|nr:hypothetical protein [Candidatus Methanoperedens sp.]
MTGLIEGDENRLLLPCAGQRRFSDGDGTKCSVFNYYITLAVKSASRRRKLNHIKIWRKRIMSKKILG